MINLNQISLIRGGRVLYENVSLTFYDQHKIGLIGANGSGKTSLFSLLLHELEPTSGEINYQGDLTIAYMRQETTAEGCLALDFVLQGDEEYYRIATAIALAEQQESYEQLADLYHQMSLIDGYTAAARAGQLLHGLGFSTAQQQQPYQSFSGGWRVRLNLARTLMSRSDVLLLDEPTNHLDLDAIFWLEKWLQAYQGLLIIISHDREFLDKVVNQIAFVDNHDVKLYHGDYTQFEAERARQLALQQATYEKQQRKISHMMKFVNRFRYKATKARQAQSRLKAIERMDQIAAVQVNTPFQFEFFEPERAPYPLLKLEQVDLGYGQTPILKNISWQLVPGDRVALVGANGAGKSTLIKALSGKLMPTHGTITIDSGVKIGYFAQHQLESLQLDKTAFDHLQVLASKKSTQELRNYLGGFGFQGDDVLKPVNAFSGGEKSRLALAMIVWQRPNLLLLDEPTNHLDMEMRMALTLALQSFEGALVIVSHDRHLIRTTVDQLWLVADKKLQLFDGSLDDYQQIVLQAEPKAASSTKLFSEDKPQKSAEKRTNPVKLATLEKQVGQLEDELKELNHRLSDEALYAPESRQQLQLLYEQQKRLQSKLKRLEEDWLREQAD